MNIAQLWTRIELGLGGLTLAGLGAFVKWLLSMRKLNAEIAEIKQRMASVEHNQKIQQLALLLLRRAECLDPNQNVCTKAQWASLLQEPNLIDEVLMALRRDGLLDESMGTIRIGPKLPTFVRG
jgi:hypothetical protein